MRNDVSTGMQIVDVLATDPKEIDFKMWLSTYNHEMALITSDCPDSDCDIDNKFNPANSPTYKKVEGSTSAATRLVQGLVLDDTTVSGGFGLEDFTFTYQSYFR